MDNNENFYLSIEGQIFTMAEFIESLEEESANGGIVNGKLLEEVDGELIEAILALQVGESIGEGLNMATITRVAPAMLYKADGTVEELDLTIGGETLDVLQKAVGGFIEHVTTTDGRDLWLNDDGKNLGLPLNVKASMLWEGYNFGDPICGDVVVTIAGLVE